MDSSTSPEVIRHMQLPGEELSFDPYDNDVAPVEEAMFSEDLARINQATAWDYRPSNDNC
jgi:hypothetical protein